MKAKRFGGPRWLGNALTRRHLFTNTDKMLSLDECCEYTAGLCEKWWEVTRLSLPDGAFYLKREMVLATTDYGSAWNLVNDPQHEKNRKQTRNVYI